LTVISLKPKGGYSVMAQRVDSKALPDDFPTPPWATRALIERALPGRIWRALSDQACLEPACGRGYMAAALRPYFRTVDSADAHDYGYGTIQDFLTVRHKPDSYDWVITNPPFKHAEEFALRALDVARVGVAVFARVQFLEGQGRYVRLLKPMPPTICSPFVERVPIFRGRLGGGKKDSTATAYAWFIWEKERIGDERRYKLIRPCREKLTRLGDYDMPPTE
jgi:hypothetical protein